MAGNVQISVMTERVTVQYPVVTLSLTMKVGQWPAIDCINGKARTLSIGDVQFSSLNNDHHLSSHGQLAVKRKWAVYHRLPPFASWWPLLYLPFRATVMHLVKTLTELLPSSWFNRVIRVFTSSHCAR